MKIDVTPEKSQRLLGYAARQFRGGSRPPLPPDRLFDDGKTEFVNRVIRLALISPSLVDDTLRQVEKEAGVTNLADPDPHAFRPGGGAARVAALLLGNRYKHEPNPEYSERTIKAFVEGVKRARARLESARLGVGTGMSLPILTGAPGTLTAASLWG